MSTMPSCLSWWSARRNGRLADAELLGDALLENAGARLDVAGLDLALQQLMHLRGDAVSIDAKHWTDRPAAAGTEI